jgi:hypothetical protein
MTQKTYKRKLIRLSVLTAVLALICLGTLVFDPERTARRSAAFAWIEPRLLDQADRIEISGSLGNTVLDRKNNLWVIQDGEVDYPVKQVRVEDFLKVLSTQGLYQVRSTSASVHERLGLTEGKASGIVIRGGAGLPLLELFIGFADAPGREVYLRKAGQNEVRSGDDLFTAYTESPRSSWYDLRLFPDITAGMVQQLRINPGIADALPYTLSRNSGGWVLSGFTPVDSAEAESWLRSLLDAQGEDFDTAMKPGDGVFSSGSVVLELDNGRTRTLRLGPVDSGNRRPASVSTFPFVYSLSEWTVGRIFKEASYFAGESG